VNVLFLTRSLELGGAERQLVTLAPALARRGHRVGVVAFYPGGPLGADLAAAGIEPRSLDKRGRWDVLGFAAGLARCIEEVAPDVVHGYLVAPNLASLVTRLVRPRARVVWGVRASDMDLARYGAFEEATFQAARVAARLADRIVFNSERGRQYHVARGYPGDRAVVIPNGIDVERFRPDRARREDARRDLGFANDARSLVGLVARLDPMKDHATFLEAAAILAARRDDVAFVAIGDGREGALATWRERATRRGLGDRVRFAGARAAIERVYPALDVATSTSAFGEGFPNAVAEAMAAGLPCAVTDVGDARRIVGDLGRVVPAGDARALADAWDALLPPAAAPAPERLRAAIVERFSVERLADRTERMLLETIEGAR